jgi:limonene-1,2-epoxide hydrolase
VENNLERSSIEPLTAESIRVLWGKTYNKEGKPDWSHLFPYYHDEIVFQDSIQRIEGKSDFKELCQRLTDRCEQLSMDIFTIGEAPGYFLFDWEMVMTFRKWPSSSIFGTTKITIAGDNRIIHQRDYFDLWGDIFNNIPYFHKPYRRFMKRYFG